jgi:hypothetical protein
MNRLLLGLLSLLYLTSCATENVPDPDLAAPSNPKMRGLGDHNVQVTTFKDTRGLPAGFLGQVKPAAANGANAERRKIETDRPVSQIVAATFRKGLRLRDMNAAEQGAEWNLSGEVVEFSCNQVARAACTAEVRVRLTKAGSTIPAFTKSYTAEKTAATTRDDNELKNMAATTLEDLVTRALDDNALRAVMLTH